MHIPFGRIVPAAAALVAALTLASCSLGGTQPPSLVEQAATVAGDSVVIPAPEADEPAATGMREVAVLAGGCFWGVQGVYQHVDGVLSAVSGYAGGAADDAHYDVVGTGTTGHAESVEITFDPSVISYGTILQIYFSVVHDPTQLDRQGPDTGTEYRSTIFPTSQAQASVAASYIAQLEAAGVYDDPIVTTIEPDRAFFAAEDYHQDFLTNNPTYPYIVINDLPKIDALKRVFPDLYSDTPVLVHPAS